MGGKIDQVRGGRTRQSARGRGRDAGDPVEKQAATVFARVGLKLKARVFLSMHALQPGDERNARSILSLPFSLLHLGFQ